MPTISETKIFGLSAPSACGKTWLIEQLIKDKVVVGWPSHTTRPPRPGEVSTNYDHVFVDPTEFSNIKTTGGFAIATMFYGHQYGLTKPKEEGILPVMVLLKPEVIRDFNTTFGSRAIIFGIHAADGLRIAEKRMQERGQSRYDIDQRLARYEAEVAMNQALIPEDRYLIAEDHPRKILPALVDEIMRCV